MDVTVSIVSYNNEDIIGHAIQSILNNTNGLEYTVIVVDNNSKDNTVGVIDNLKSNMVKIVRNCDNIGFGRAHNLAIRQSGAKYHLVLNPDVIIKNNIIRELYDFMECNRDVGMVTPKVTFPNGEPQYLCKQLPTVSDLFLRRFLPRSLQRYYKCRSDRYEMRETGYDKVFPVPYATGCFMFFRRTVLSRINGFDERFFMYLEDADITRKTNEISTCVFYPHNSIEHQWARGSHRSLRLTWINIQSVFRYFKKWGWKFY